MKNKQSKTKSSWLKVLYVSVCYRCCLDFSIYQDNSDSTVSINSSLYLVNTNIVNTVVVNGNVGYVVIEKSYIWHI